MLGEEVLFMEDELTSIFFPNISAEYARLRESPINFVHYTSAEAALKIIKSRKIWLRNTNVMNDASEVRHGTNLVRQFFASDKGRPFFECLNRLYEGSEYRLKRLYDEWVEDLEANTYVCCLSEHDDSITPSGTLSMWRAYGRSNGVALVLNPYFLYSDTTEHQTYSYPIFYKTDEEAGEMFQDFCKNFIMAESQLHSLDDDTLLNWSHGALQAFAITLKHPAFREEKEWRIVHRPIQNPSQTVLPIMESIGGVAQTIYELPIHNETIQTTNNLRIEALLERVIIGPSQAPDVVARALVNALTPLLGFDDAVYKIRQTSIPLRTDG